MGLNKFSIESDKAANLYRAAFYLAKGSKEVGLKFLNKSGKEFKDIKTGNEEQRLFWAEKILDEYIKLKHNG